MFTRMIRENKLFSCAESVLPSDGDMRGSYPDVPDLFIIPRAAGVCKCFRKFS